MRVEEYDGLFRVLVTSDSIPGKKYLVDLEEHWGNGKCDCTNFRTKRLPALNRLPPNERPKWNSDDDRFRCKHITEAIRVQAPKLLSAFLRAKAMAERKLELKSNEHRNSPEQR